MLKKVIKRDTILKNIPHGEDGELQLEKDAAIALCDILLNHGYAVCLTGGDFDHDVSVRWLYAGDVDDLNWSNYDNVAFFNPDYLEDYPQALDEQFSGGDPIPTSPLLEREDYLD